MALAAAGVRFEIVPGITSATSAPALAGIPVTHRGLARSFVVVTGHTASPDPCELPWPALARIDTVVVLMGLANLRTIVTRLVAAGRSPDTPVAVISNGTTPEQCVVRGTLANIADRACGLPSPATIVIGEVVALNAHAVPATVMAARSA